MHSVLSRSREFRGLSFPFSPKTENNGAELRKMASKVLKEAAGPSLVFQDFPIWKDSVLAAI